MPFLQTALKYHRATDVIVVISVGGAIAGGLPTGGIGAAPGALFGAIGGGAAGVVAGGVRELIHQLRN